MRAAAYGKGASDFWPVAGDGIRRPKALPRTFGCRTCPPAPLGTGTMTISERECASGTACPLPAARFCGRGHSARTSCPGPGLLSPASLPYSDTATGTITKVSGRADAPAAAPSGRGIEMAAPPGHPPGIGDRQEESLFMSLLPPPGCVLRGRGGISRRLGSSRSSGSAEFTTSSHRRSNPSGRAKSPEQSPFGSILCMLIPIGARD